MKHLVLIGFMGSGKSTIAQSLSTLLSLPLFSTDQEIEKETKLSISEIFQSFGEEFFRAKENEIFSQIKTLDSPHIIDCGGGFGIYQNVNELGKVIFLDVTFEEIKRRLRADEEKFKQNKNIKEEKGVVLKRPLFDSRLKVRFDSRLKTYQNKADIILNNSISLEESIKELKNHLF